MIVFHTDDLKPRRFANSGGIIYDNEEYDDDDENENDDSNTNTSSKNRRRGKKGELVRRGSYDANNKSSPRDRYIRSKHIVFLPFLPSITLLYTLHVIPSMCIDVASISLL